MQVADQCVYDTGNPTYDSGETEKIVAVDDHYITEHAPTIERRLKQASVRLAHLLNQTFGITPSEGLCTRCFSYRTINGRAPCDAYEKWLIEPASKRAECSMFISSH